MERPLLKILSPSLSLSQALHPIHGIIKATMVPVLQLEPSLVKEEDYFLKN